MIIATAPTIKLYLGSAHDLHADLKTLKNLADLKPQKNYYFPSKLILFRNIEPCFRNNEP